MRISKKQFLGTLCGVFLEYFDYTLYGFSAPIIASLFFPNEKPAIELLLAWMVFAISFLVRPVGAIIFGHIADRLGRRPILIATILLMSFSTTGIGLLPTYQTAGLLAPILLLCCRLLQGLAVSTEYSGCSTYLLEFKKSHQGLVSGVITSASGFGIFCASLLVLLFHQGHWRMPFIIAGLLVGVLGFYLRLGLMESPEFLKLKKQNAIVRFPLIQLLQKNPRKLLKSIIISAYVGIAIICIEIYLPTYLQTHFNFSRNRALEISTSIALLEAFLAIFFGFISDFIDKSKVIIFSGITMILFIFPILKLFNIHSYLIILFATFLLACIIAAVDGPIAAYLVNCFSTETRYTGVSISYSVGAALFGGVSPAVIIALQNHFLNYTIFGWYLMCSAIIMIVSLKCL